MADTMTRLSFRATVAREGGDWVAHCLDLDLVATGPTAEVAMDELAGAVEVQLWYARAQDNFEYLFRPAPAEAWERFGEILKVPHHTILRQINDTDEGVSLEVQVVAA